MKIDVDKMENKTDLIEMLYKYRYYNLLPVDDSNFICNIPDLKKDMEDLTKELINKVIEMKILIKITNNKDINDNIIKQVLLSKVIKFEDINIKITNEKDGTYLIIYDEDTKDSKIKIEDMKKEDLLIKANKKTKLFI